MNGDKMRITRKITTQIFALSLVFIILTVIFSSLTVTVHAPTIVIVGVFYYPWYPITGWGTGHWNESSPYPTWNVVDKPLIGYYGCDNVTVIKTQLDEMRSVGIDFLLISWWGPWNDSDAYSQGLTYTTVDNITQIIFQTVNSYAPTMKIALMVEDYEESGTYNITNVYSYILNAYAIPYNNIYLQLYNKPLVVWWNQVHTTDNPVHRAQIVSDNRVEARLFGHRSDYFEWYGWIPCSVNSSSTIPVNQMDGFTCIEPRYDDTSIGRTSAFDQSLNGNLYDTEWKEAIEGTTDGAVKIVAIYSWNEYHERSFIEPAYDHTTGKSSTYLLNKTHYYINEIKNLTIIPRTIDWTRVLITAVIVESTVIVVLVLVIARAREIR